MKKVAAALSLLLLAQNVSPANAGFFGGEVTFERDEDGKKGKVHVEPSMIEKFYLLMMAGQVAAENPELVAGGAVGGLLGYASAPFATKYFASTLTFLEQNPGVSTIGLLGIFGFGAYAWNQYKDTQTGRTIASYAKFIGGGLAGYAAGVFGRAQL